MWVFAATKCESNLTKLWVAPTFLWVTPTFLWVATHNLWPFNPQICGFLTHIFVRYVSLFCALQLTKLWLASHNFVCCNSQFCDLQLTILWVATHKKATRISQKCGLQATNLWVERPQIVGCNSQQCGFNPQFCEVGLTFCGSKHSHFVTSKAHNCELQPTTLPQWLARCAFETWRRRSSGRPMMRHLGHLTKKGQGVGMGACHWQAGQREC